MSDALISMASDHCRAAFAPNGTLRALALRRPDGWETLDFRGDDWAGPSWHGEWDGASRRVALRRVEADAPRFTGEDGALHFTLDYTPAAAGLAIRASIMNAGTSTFRPQRCSLKLGLDTWMESFPAWRRKYFPTLLRCEATHFWGYAMTPVGRLLGIASPDPVASWSLDYNTVNYGEPYDWGGHRIRTLNLDLLNALPLPPRHPQHLDGLAPGERRAWTIYLADIPDPASVQAVLAPLCRAPLLALDRTTVAAGEPIQVRVYAAAPPQLWARAPDGAETALPLSSAGLGVFEATYTPCGAPGLRTLTALSADGRRAEAIAAVRHPWGWYLVCAREEAWRCPPTASQTSESWYGFYSLYLAERHFPDPVLRARADTRWNRLYPLLFDPIRHAPQVHPNRIQNTACTIGMLAARYRVTGERTDLERAAGLADWLMTRQRADGAYCSSPDSTGHYTSVVYPAKSLMELIAAERDLARHESAWRARVERQRQSVRLAVEALARRRDDIQTEGELTFEDGMISCSALQLALAALHETTPAERRRLTEAALEMLALHRCLAQLVIPDARMRGGTLRFWEAQYDVNTIPNMMNSPHGWSAWRTYATWYAYLLTGEEEWLRQTFDALGSGVQCLDADTGRLRWAFVPDPYIRATALAAPPRPVDPDGLHIGHRHPSQGPRRTVVLGEQYVEMVSNWQFHQAGDNDVHEHFKCLEEIALTAVYVVERASGELVVYNGRLIERDGVPTIEPAEAVVCRAHLNLQRPEQLAIRFADAPLTGKFEGRVWVGPGGVPELLRPD